MSTTRELLFRVTAARPGRIRRRGAALAMAVLGVATMLMLIAVSTMELTQSRLKAEEMLCDAEQSRLGAISALETAIQYCNSTPTWRTAMTHGSPANRVLANNKIIFTLYDDSDANLSNRDSDAVRISGTAECGVAKQAMTMTARPLALSCLDSAAHAVGNLTNDNTLTNNKPVSANRVINNGVINGDVESSTTTSNLNVINGTIKNGVPVKEVPGANVVSFYSSTASPMSYAAIPSVAGKKTITQQLISPSRNPYGTTNPNGLYVLDCGGGMITIDSCRIVGTLIIVNLDPASRIEKSMNWEPVITNYPALIVSGSIIIALSGTDLLEAGGSNPNFNPADTPYKGASNSTSIDVYPCYLRGLIYATGDITTEQSTSINGTLIAGVNMYLRGTTTLTHDSTYVNNPPPCFVSHRLAVNLGSWRPD